MGGGKNTGGNGLKTGQERGSKGKPTRANTGQLGKALANQQRAAQHARVHQLIARADETTMETERGKGKLRSVTECDDLEDFMAQATLANTDFTAIERAHQVVLKSSVVSGARTERVPLQRALLRVPRRPHWGAQTTPDELTQAENRAFLEWRRGLAEMEESGALLTPFERNLEVWRQLWRVLERCDLVVQIVDARNPLFFKCDDLDDYVAELAGPTGCLAPPAADALLLGGGAGGAADAAGGVGRVAKRSLLLLNKADLLPPPLRARWAAYLTARGVSFAFFSALVAGEEVEAAQKQYASSLRAALEQGAADAEAAADAVEAALQRGGLATAPVRAAGAADAAADADAEPAAPPSPPVLIARSFAPDHVFNRDELLAHLLALCPQRHASPSPDAEPLAHRLFRFNIGFVGYPNVGKSSTINALAADKRVSVSATPGKTKHFQTLACPDEPELCICDCPGLVFPALAGSKAQMYCDGVLPIDNVRDHMPAVDELVGRVPRRELERAYALRLALRLDGDDPEPLSAAHELLVAHGLIHSFLNKGGQVDEAKSARTILKDLVSGKLRHWSTPPDGLADHDDLRFGDDAARASADEMSETAAGRRTITAERYLRDSRFDAQDGVLGVVGGDLGRGGVGGGALAAGARGGKAARRRQMEAADAARRAAAGALGNRLPNRMVATGPSIE